jgi:hypothetical protein
MEPGFDVVLEEVVEFSCCDGWRARMGVGAFGSTGVATGIFGEA